MSGERPRPAPPTVARTLLPRSCNEMQPTGWKGLVIPILDFPTCTHMHYLDFRLLSILLCLFNQPLLPGRQRGRFPSCGCLRGCWPRVRWPWVRWPGCCRASVSLGLRLRLRSRGRGGGMLGWWPRWRGSASVQKNNNKWKWKINLNICFPPSLE